MPHFQPLRISRFSVSSLLALATTATLPLACSDGTGPGGSGGTSNGSGGASTGGASHGGRSGSGTGGASHGGTSASSGGSSGGAGTASSGGAGTGGTASGGAASGGTASGGTASGGTRCSAGGEANPAGGSPPNGDEGGGVGLAGDTSLGGAPTSGGTGATTGGTVGSGGNSGTEAGAGGEPEMPEFDDPNVEWLGPCTPVDLSEDGETALAKEGLWTRDSGWLTLPDLPGGDVRNSPEILSGDGSTVFGSSSSALGDEIYRFTRDGGIEGLGRVYLGTPTFSKGMGTTTDGHTLVTCGDDDGLRKALRWTLGDTFHGLELALLIPEFSSDGLGGYESPCGYGGSSISGNGLTIAADTGGDAGIIFQSSMTVQLLQEYPWRLARLGAISGDGQVIAAYSFGTLGSAVETSHCLAAPEDCPPSDVLNIVTDLSYDGSSGVGTQILFSLTDPFSFYWSQASGFDYVSEAFLRGGVHVDALPGAPLAVSASGQKLFGAATRHHRDGSHTDECYLATFGDAPEDLEPALPPPPSASCGNGWLDPGEACDDGNTNNADACSTRCERLTLAAGRNNTCALHGANVECWGADASTLFTGDAARAWSPVVVPGVQGAVQIANSGDHACALLQTGKVRCWGNNLSGQLGDGTTAIGDSAVEVSGLDDAIQVSVGPRHSCALLAAGTVRCWGANVFGALGDGSFVDSTLPVAVSNLTGVTQISLGADESCALLDDHTVECWGKLDEDDGSATTTPTPMSALHDVRQLELTDDGFGYVLHFDGSAQVFLNLGSGFQNPVLGLSLANTLELAGGSGYACLLLDDGRVHCSGENNLGELGSGRREAHGPAAVIGIHDAVEISGGTSHVCARLESGKVRCWGYDFYGQLGIGYVYRNYPNGTATPVDVRGFP